MIEFRRFALASSIALALAAPATAGMTLPEPEVRLIVPGGGPFDGAHRIALEIRLPEGWHTYWRNPGEAGIPPVFDTAGSANLAGFSVAYPAPERWTDGFSTSFVYHDLIVLPLTVAAGDPAQPVDLALGIDLGYCREICVPWRADLSARLDPAAAVDEEAAARLEQALAALPASEVEAGPDAPRLTGIERIGDDANTAVLRLTVEAADPASVDLFAEPPDGWYLAASAKVSAADGRAVFDLPLKGMPKSASVEGAPFRFTITTGSSAVEVERSLD